MNIKREEFTIDGTKLILEDRIDTKHPSLSERILWIAGTFAFYSAVPLCPASHRLLCFDYCADAMKKREPQFYKNALILGCGGGAIPRWLLEEYPSINVDVVDRSQEIIEICKKYFLQRWKNSDRLRYHCIDARDFESECRYEFIFCDLFNGEELAPVVYDPDFAEKLHRLVCDDGLLVINCGWDSLGKVHKVYTDVFKYRQILLREPWQTQVLKVSDDYHTLHG